MTCEACQEAGPIYEAGCPGCEARAMESLNKGVSMEWKPIETAPRDGTDILVMYMHIDTQIVHNAFYASESEGWDAGEIGWWSYEHSEVSRIHLTDWMSPTHWMPLPNPPKESHVDASQKS